MTLEEMRIIHSALLASGEWMMYCGDEEVMNDPEYQRDSDKIEKAIDIICKLIEENKS